MSKILLIAYLLLFVCSCQNKGVNKKYVLCTDPELKQKEHGMLYKGKPYTGIIYAMYVVNDTQFRETYVKGMKEGETLKWYRGGKLWQQLYYTNSLPDSVHTCWWENGRKKSAIVYKNGQLEGVSESWYSSGLRKAKYNYKNGNEEGVQSEWARDGRPHTSYQIYNGNKINLITSKSCVYVR